jgi:hypothetical protein
MGCTKNQTLFAVKFSADKTLNLTGRFGTVDQVGVKNCKLQS